MMQGRPEMRLRDGGLLAHGVRAKRVDEAAQWLLQEWAKAVSQSFFFIEARNM